MQHYNTIQNEFITRRFVQTKTNGSKEAKLWECIRAGETFAFKVTFKTIHKSCSTAVKRQVIPDLWSDMASVHFGPSARRTDILVRWQINPCYWEEDKKDKRRQEHSDSALWYRAWFCDGGGHQMTTTTTTRVQCGCSSCDCARTTRHASERGRSTDSGRPSACTVWSPPPATTYASSPSTAGREGGRVGGWRWPQRSRRQARGNSATTSTVTIYIRRYVLCPPQRWT